jgi:hypothetical protein
LRQSAAPHPKPLGSGASGGAKRRNKTIAPYGPHLASFNFLSPLICVVASSSAASSITTIISSRVSEAEKLAY